MKSRGPGAEAGRRGPRRLPGVRGLAAIPALLAAAMLHADTPPSPEAARLGAASNFSQGWRDETWRAALDLPVPRLRDSIRWSEVEREAGIYTFDKPTTTWPDRFAGSGMRITLTLNWGNPLYDDGHTPHSPEALAAFGRFAAAVVRRFPQIDTLEIGNEVNAGNFVSGPVRDAGLAERGAYHLAMVRAAARAVGEARPDVTILGGATHSLPAGFLWPLLEQPGAEAIGGLAVHPYTTPIDQLATQIAFVRRHPEAARRPWHVTEFGTQDSARAADDLVRGYATLAALGIAEFDWYPLNERGDGLVPLIRRDGTLTDAGRAFRFVQSRLGALPARDASPDPFTFVRAFGPRIRVLWGAAREVRIDAAGVSAFDATGMPLSPEALALRPDKAIILIGAQPLTDQSVRLGCQTLIADSFYQFGYPEAGGGQAAGDGFARMVRLPDGESPLTVMPGQHRSYVPWTPYLGRPDMLNLRLNADTLIPAVDGSEGAIIHRYVAPRDSRLHLIAEFIVASRSEDGIRVTLTRNGEEHLIGAGRDPIRIDSYLTMAEGEAISLAVGPRDNPRGDVTAYRISLHDEERCSGTR